jgi:hypothetical protein
MGDLDRGIYNSQFICGCLKWKFRTEYLLFPELCYRESRCFAARGGYGFGPVISIERCIATTDAGTEQGDYIPIYIPARRFKQDDDSYGLYCVRILDANMTVN